MTISDLKPYQDKTVVLRFRDGEVAKVKVAFVDVEHEDIIADIVETNRPEKYKAPLSSCAFAILAADLSSVKEISD
jgi:hypothetical protein